MCFSTETAMVCLSEGMTLTINITQMTTLANQVIDRRANCRIGNAVALSFFFSLFATVPMSIRQRDWKLWALPFAAGAAIMLTGAMQAKDGEVPPAYKLLGYSAGAAVSGLLLKNNKDDANNA